MNTIHFKFKCCSSQNITTAPSASCDGFVRCILIWVSGKWLLRTSNVKFNKVKSTVQKQSSLKGFLPVMGWSIHLVFGLDDIFVALSETELLVAAKYQTLSTLHAVLFVLPQEGCCATVFC